MQLYDLLQSLFPEIGIVLDCCTKPSHDLGRSDYFNSMFSEMHKYLMDNGIKNILTACPSCFAVFNRYAEGLVTQSVYDILATEKWQVESGLPQTTVTIQDSCVARLEKNMQDSVRKLIRAQGISFEEMKHHGKKTLCCGEGGGAHFVAPELAGQWGEIPKSATGIDCRALVERHDADVTIINPDAAWTVDPNQFKSKSRNTPFAGRELKGRADTVIVGGEVKLV